MAVFIEEIVFRGEVAEGRVREGSRERQPSREREDRERLVRAAVSEVMRILRRERER